MWISEFADKKYTNNEGRLYYVIIDHNTML